MHSIPALRRLRQEDHEFEVSMSYVPYLKTAKDQKVLFIFLQRELYYPPLPHSECPTSVLNEC